MFVLAEERERLCSQAAELGIVDPLDGELIRQESWRCVFLSDEHLCRIHSRWGFDQKPAVCQQYPLAVVSVDTPTTRVAIDPGCANAWRDWRDGPDVELRAHVMSDGRRTIEWEAEEEALLALLDPEARDLTAILDALQTSPEEIASRLSTSNLELRLIHPGNSGAIRDRLSHVAAFIGTLGPPPPLDLTPEQESWGIEVARRFLYIRPSRDGRPLTHAIAMLVGVYACGWADPDPERFGPALSAWSRAMRTDAWRTLFSSHTPQRP